MFFFKENQNNLNSEEERIIHLIGEQLKANPDINEFAFDRFIKPPFDHLGGINYIKNIRIFFRIRFPKETSQRKQKILYFFCAHENIKIIFLFTDQNHTALKMYLCFYSTGGDRVL